MDCASWFTGCRTKSRTKIITLSGFRSKNRGKVIFDIRIHNSASNFRELIPTGSLDRSMERYRLVSREEALSLDSSYKQACHALLYAPCKDRLFGRIPIRYAIMMQMRFDGMIGFVGGFVDSGEDLTSGLRREVAEELGFAADEIEWSDDDHVTSHVDEINKFCLHFYAKRLTFEKFVAIERHSVNAVDHGLEVLGTIRCPVYTWKDTLGLPSFLRNNFVGMARDQLLDCLEREKILTREQIDVALKATRETTKK